MKPEQAKAHLDVDKRIIERKRIRAAERAKELLVTDEDE
jgi:hypothetical protein